MRWMRISMKHQLLKCQDFLIPSNFQAVYLEHQGYMPIYHFKTKDSISPWLTDKGLKVISPPAPWTFTSFVLIRFNLQIGGYLLFIGVWKYMRNLVIIFPGLFYLPILEFFLFFYRLMSLNHLFHEHGQHVSGCIIQHLNS